MTAPNNVTQSIATPPQEQIDLPVQQTLDQTMQRITEVSTLPHIAARVIKVANDPAAGVTDLCQIVESDPALSSRIIKCVNSAAYGLRFRINNLQRAISYLGFKQVRNLAVTASVSELFKNNDPIGNYRRTDLWQHLVSVAVCSRMIATRQKVALFEEAFLAGLLHDIGIILEDQYCHEAFVSVIENLPTPEPADNIKTLLHAELKAFGFDHALLGKRVAEHWRFPPEVCDTIRFHHIVDNYHGEHKTILACVVIANLICNLKGITSIGVRLITPSIKAINDLNLNKEDLKVLANDLDEELKMNQSLFTI
jgi:putative nucleotidyltransferase with HDIG domain